MNEGGPRPAGLVVAGGVFDKGELLEEKLKVVVLANLLGKIPGAIKKTGRVKVGIREPEITGKKSKVDQIVVNEQPATRLSES